MMLNRIVNAVAKRFPAHAKDRAEELLFGLRDFERLTIPAQAALTVVCDDGELKDLDIVEVLSGFGLKGVFAVSPDLIGRPGFLTYGQLREIRHAGHEIAFHGTTHDPFTSFCDEGLLRATVREGIARLNGEGLGTPTTLIYPFGRHDRAVRAAMGSIFGGAFTTWFGMNKGQANRYAIRRIPFGAYTGKLPATEEWYRDMIDRAAAGNCWPTLMLHPGATEHSADHTSLLSRLLRHAAERGLPVRTAATHLDVSAPHSAAGVANSLQGGQSS